MPGKFSKCILFIAGLFLFQYLAVTSEASTRIVFYSQLSGNDERVQHLYSSCFRTLIENCNDSGIIAAEGGLTLGDDAPQKLEELYGNNKTIFARIEAVNANGWWFARITFSGDPKLVAAVGSAFEVKSLVSANIPVRLTREILIRSQNIPLEAKVEAVENTKLLLDIGEADGIHENKISFKDGSDAKVVSLQSDKVLIEYKSTKPVDSIFEVSRNRVSKNLLEKLDSEEKNNLINTYGFEAKYFQKTPGQAYQRFIEGATVINVGGSLLLPGYGSYLSTIYLGFPESTPDYAPIIAGTVNPLLHLLMPDFITGFKINFCPWIMDTDKTKSEQRLQIFLWSSIPVAYTVTYFDQLAMQYKKNNVLPPFLKNENRTTILMSLLVPGGGLFYKNYRFSGWLSYYMEMSIASYAVYNWNNADLRNYSLLALVALKGCETALALLLTPDYKLYREELGVNSSFNVGLAFIPEKNNNRFIGQISCQF